MSPNPPSIEEKNELVNYTVNRFEEEFNHASLCHENEEGCTCKAQDWLRAALLEAERRGRKEEWEKIYSLWKEAIVYFVDGKTGEERADALNYFSNRFYDRRLSPSDDLEA